MTRASVDPIRRTALRALFLVLLSRNRRVTMSVVTAIAVLMALELARKGFNVASLSAWPLGGAMMLPLAPAVGLVREKADGSLRFLAFLPISGEEHALARALVSITMAAPAAVLLGFAFPLMVAGISLRLSIAVGVGGWATLAATSLLMTAIQLRAPIGRGAVAAIYWIGGFLVLVRLVEAVRDEPAVLAVGRFLATPAGLGVASLTAGLILAAMVGFAVRVIAIEGPRYQGEIAAA